MSVISQIDGPNVGVLTELDCRENLDYKVQLMWQPVTKRLYIRVDDKATGRLTTQRVPNDQGRQAFEHPFSYLKT